MASPAGADHDSVQTSDPEPLDTLTPAECRQLLDEGRIGYLGLSIRALPVVIPVNYAMMDGDVVVRIDAGTKLDAALADAVVAFEVDAVDPTGHEGRVVGVQGRASEIVDPDELQRAGQLSLRPWAHGVRDHVIRIRTDVVSGRRIPVHVTTNGNGRVHAPVRVAHPAAEHALEG